MNNGGHWAGEVIGAKTLVAYAGRNPHGHHLWLWDCVHCETTYGPSTIAHLKRSRRCQECARRRENNGRWLGFEQISGSWLYQYRSDARKKGRVWEVTAEQLWDLWIAQEGRCAYTSWPLSHGVDASLDRIDSQGGYTLDNVQWVHRDVNRVKSDLGDEYFRQLCTAVAVQQVLDVVEA